MRVPRRLVASSAFNVLLVIASVFVGTLQRPLYIGFLLATLAIAAIIQSGIQYREWALKPKRDRIQKACEDEVLPWLVERYKQEHPDSDPPDIRANVMLLYRRDLIPGFLKGQRTLFPWEKSLQIDAYHGDYGVNPEQSLKWRTGEGVAGSAINPKAQEVWTGIEDDVQAAWDLTDKQLATTNHVGSLLSVPIYRKSDEEKVYPVGVLNIDSQEHIDETQFGREDIRGITIKAANIVGAIAE